MDKKEFERLKSEILKLNQEYENKGENLTYVKLNKKLLRSITVIREVVIKSKIKLFKYRRDTIILRDK